jgi:hypothetical protein
MKPVLPDIMLRSERVTRLRNWPLSKMWVNHASVCWSVRLPLSLKSVAAAL